MNALLRPSSKGRSVQSALDLKALLRQRVRCGNRRCRQFSPDAPLGFASYSRLDPILAAFPKDCGGGATLPEGRDAVTPSRVRPRATGSRPEGRGPRFASVGSPKGSGFGSALSTSCPEGRAAERCRSCRLARGRGHSCGGVVGPALAPCTRHRSVLLALAETSACGGQSLTHCEQ